jgi:hypothetical protein
MVLVRVGNHLQDFTVSNTERLICLGLGEIVFWSLCLFVRCSAAAISRYVSITCRRAEG